MLKNKYSKILILLIFTILFSFQNCKNLSTQSPYGSTPNSQGQKNNDPHKNNNQMDGGGGGISDGTGATMSLPNGYGRYAQSENSYQEFLKNNPIVDPEKMLTSNDPNLMIYTNFTPGVDLPNCPNGDEPNFYKSTFNVLTNEVRYYNQPCNQNAFTIIPPDKVIKRTEFSLVFQIVQRDIFGNQRAYQYAFSKQEFKTTDSISLLWVCHSLNVVGESHYYLTQLSPPSGNNNVYEYSSKSQHFKEQTYSDILDARVFVEGSFMDLNNPVRSAQIIRDETDYQDPTQIQNVLDAISDVTTFSELSFELDSKYIDFDTLILNAPEETTIDRRLCYNALNARR